MYSLHFEAGAHQMLGDRVKALAAIEEQMRELDNSSGIAQGHFQANQCFIHWMEADLKAVMQAARGALKTAEGSKKQQAIYQAHYFVGIACYHRNELQVAEENLVRVTKEPYAQHSLNFAHGAFALALLHQAQGRADEASEISESVVSFGHAANHPDVLRIARAFQAELALRQGRLAEASHWAEQFVAQPLTLMYRFYVPQFTLVKVLLAQDTRPSREQAADLLKQLYEFVISTHSRRFQIDVLALQALLYDSQGKEPAALKRLTNALQLAEPGGFIRLFVDLGPQMFGLLKRLVQQDVALDHIGKILAAFRDDEPAVVPEPADRPAESPRQPRRPSPFSQPLVEPLTSRELDVLQLLAERLSNKEVAARLFISPKTVKKHLDNIYGKLNVTGRRESVEKALALGILRSP
jgi:LuxR family maltose regulon positive regulatory protein